MSFVEEPVDKWSIQAVDSLLMRSYWSRMWIIQEVVLAKARLILCGEELIDFDKFDLTVDFWRTTRSTSNLSDDHLLSVDIDRMLSHGHFSSVWDLSFLAIEQLGRRNIEPDILSLIKRTLGFFCTDPRDRFYSIFGPLIVNSCQCNQATNSLLKRSI
jgi:hypothetical protein